MQIPDHAGRTRLSQPPVRRLFLFQGTIPNKEETQMQRGIHITFPVKKKNKPDTYRTMANYRELGDSRCFWLHETKRQLRHKRHVVTEGCIIEDLVTGERFKCVKVIVPDIRPKCPIMQVVPI
jgi:hypothetical protein